MDYDVIIIGGGPSGLTAAIYTSRSRLKTLIIESYSVACQAVTADHIENYPGFPEGINGFELISKFRKQAEKFGAEFIAAGVRSVKEAASGFQVETEEKTYTSVSVIIASGSSPKRLDVPGEDKLRGKGVSYCATCDGPLFRDKRVVVAGGGDAALEEALFLTRFVEKVTVVHRRDALRATKILQERAFANKKIEIIWDSVITEIVGPAKVTAVKIKNVKTSAETNFPCDGVFVFVGYTPNTAFLKDIAHLDESGYIIADDNCLTSKPGIFACGDCRKKLLRQVVTAAGDGAVAAFACHRYLESK